MAEHVPTDTQRRQVETMAGFGIPEYDIGRTLGIDPKTLRKHYRDELDMGHIKANSAVAQSLYRRATDPDAGREGVTAAIFWLKCRAGWREASPLDMPRQQAPEEERLGKKELADRASEIAGKGTGWGDLVH